jgi:hypothetical protein
MFLLSTKTAIEIWSEEHFKGDHIVPVLVELFKQNDRFDTGKQPMAVFSKREIGPPNDDSDSD